MNINLDYICNIPSEYKRFKEIDNLIDKGYLTITTLEDYYLHSTNIKYIISFARYYYKDINISKLEDIIVLSKKEEYIYSFAKNVNGANILQISYNIID